MIVNTSLWEHCKSSYSSTNSKKNAYASHIDWRCGAENIQGYHCHDPTDAERRHDDVARLILQLLIQPTSKHLQRLIQCVRKEFED